MLVVVVAFIKSLKLLFLRLGLVRGINHKGLLSLLARVRLTLDLPVPGGLLSRYIYL